jgi:hypothetical protein
MRQIFSSDTHEQLFRRRGYVVVDLLGEPAIGKLWSFYEDAFHAKRPVVPYAQQLPYYISIFDQDPAHKRRVDELISAYVREALPALMIDYEVFYSNFMIKFPGDGQIEAHQDFNFVCKLNILPSIVVPLVDTNKQNGGLFRYTKHNVFERGRAQLQKALCTMTSSRNGRWIPLNKGQAIIFDTN